MQHLIVKLQAPTMNFGTVKVDRHVATNRFPTTSMLTGLLANALGYDRRERDRIQQLQDRLVHASRIDRKCPEILQEYQTAQMHQGERAWTPTGEPEERGGGNTYQQQQIWQEYLQDTSITVAIRLEPSQQEPTLDKIAQALRKPERPLFIGKKHCLPSARILEGFQEGDTTLDALLRWPIEDEEKSLQVSWSPGEETPRAMVTRETRTRISDLKNWETGVHGGDRSVLEGTVYLKNPEDPGKGEREE